MNIKLKDGGILELTDGASALDAAVKISAGLARAALACTINGEVCDLRTALRDEDALSILTFEDGAGKDVLRHTAAHILAQAVKRLYPETKLAIGPAIENGFYYDFDTQTALSPDILDKLEDEMRNIIKADLKIERFTLPKDKAIGFMTERGETYKLELIRDLPENAVIRFYRQGEFCDLCAGPDAPSTGCVRAFRLTSCTGAYWRGDSKNKMLQRVYGTAFTKKSDMEAYLAAVEEAKKRDHNKIGRELEYFTTVDVIGQGLPILLPKGARVLQLLQRFVEDTERRRGYQLTKTPLMAKSDLYKISGHWDHYKEGMFVMGDERDPDSEVFALRPMTCPFQYQVFLNRSRSYRDLPMRLAETSTLFRNEDSGEMHGLIRVRQFTISEGHLILRPEQLEEEFTGCLELAKYMLETLGLAEDVHYRFSQWDPGDRSSYIGTPEQWDEAQGVMERILDNLGIDYKVGIGDAAFYGPKLDIQIKNVYGKEDTLITLQIDQMLAETFGMEYVDHDGKKRRPYIIHRTSIGCYERTLALLLEKYAGALPCWLMPTQAVVMPVTDRTAELAKEIAGRLENAGIRAQADLRSEKIGYKIRSAQLEKVPYMLIVGDKEAETDLVSVRARSRGDLGAMSLDGFLGMIGEEIRTKAREW